MTDTPKRQRKVHAVRLPPNKWNAGRARCGILLSKSTLLSVRTEEVTCEKCLERIAQAIVAKSPEPEPEAIHAVKKRPSKFLAGRAACGAVLEFGSPLHTRGHGVTCQACIKVFADQERQSCPTSAS